MPRWPRAPYPAATAPAAATNVTASHQAARLPRGRGRAAASTASTASAAVAIQSSAVEIAGASAWLARDTMPVAITAANAPSGRAPTARVNRLIRQCRNAERRSCQAIQR
jgi:hypothetical protein